MFAGQSGLGVIARLAVLFKDGFSGLGVMDRRTLFFAGDFNSFVLGNGVTTLGAFSVLTGVPHGVAYKSNKG